MVRVPERNAEIGRIDEVMRSKGCFTDAVSGLQYFTGYSYETLYDWDQYFEGIIQRYVGWDTRLMRNGVKIFLANQDEKGFIYRSVPRPKEEGWGQKDEHVKPFLAQILLLIHEKDGSFGDFSEAEYEKLKRYLNYWLFDMDKDGDRLSTWDSAPHSGMDNQHERAGWWYDCFCSGVDLNAFIVRECRAMAKVAKLLGREDDSAYYLEQAQCVSNAVQTLWDETDGIYYDRDARTGKAIKVKYVGAFAPLWAGIATPEQAKALVERHLTNPDEFWRAFPVPAYAASEPGYTEGMLENDLGCNWRAYTWIPTNYYVFHGLMRYGYSDLAKELARITGEAVRKIGPREYYTTDSGKGAGLDPFWGWSLLAYFMEWEAETGYDPTLLE